MINKLFYILFVLNILISSQTVQGKDITVCKDCEIKTIRQALDLSEDGDRIIIKKGVYIENNLSSK
jgi:nitrous oxidase accessory protein